MTIVRSIQIAAASTALALTGCATPAGGRYLLISSGERVVAEIDTGAGGQNSCSNQVAMIRLHAGYVASCSDAPASSPLPYSYKVHMQVRESDGFKPSSPYWVRTDTKARCASMRDGTSRGEKVVIIENRCS
jgi:hypothetical protein